jgi:hypothetical protein
MNQMNRCFLAALTVVLVISFVPSRSRADDPPTASVSSDEAARSDAFETHIRPLLLKHCAACHGAEEQEAGLRVDTAALVSEGGESGPAIVVGQPDASRLIQVIRYDSGIQMPPDGKLDVSEIRVLEDWVRDGAFWPKSASNAEIASKDGMEAEPSASSTTGDKAKDHWAFQPVTAPALPDTRDIDWPTGAIDRYVLAGLEEQGLRPSERASRRELIRRATYDLTGLPPTAEEIKAFENDDHLDAYAILIERLLQSPRYGERWGRHWLDVARYADTKGYVGVGEGDLERREYPYAFAFRDWVIGALNADLGYDDFLKRQIAADVMQLEDQASLAALGFFRVGRVFLNNRNDQIDDKIDAMTRGMLGLTVACARCHDHKFDPIPTADYYALFGVFASTDEPDDAENQRMLLADSANPHNVRVFKRGNPATQGEEAPRAFLSVLSRDEDKPFDEGSGRKQLAAAIADASNPLTSRVIVNRIWAHHFGKPLVDTPSDFGVRTPRPLQGSLLDYLASELVARDWSLKEMHREIMLSNTYCQSSRERSECVAVDAENRRLWRQNRRRLDLEQMRDTMLAAAGALDLTMGGPSQELTREPFSQRRSVYGRIDRQNLPGMFRTFDFANPDSHNAGRYLTTVPQQGLFMMNHPFVIQQASKIQSDFSGQLRSDEQRVEAIYERVLGRSPSAEETSFAIEFVRQGKSDTNDAVQDSVDASGWANLAQALLMTNEFMFID